jgi:WD40 repeat protein
METKLDRSGPDGRLEFSEDRLIVRHDHAPPLAFDMQPGSAFRETWVAPGLRRIAWSDDGKQLCAISSTDIYWLSRDSLRTEGTAPGSNPGGVAFEPSLKQWVVPHNDQYLSRWLSGAGDVNSTPRETRWSFQPADKDRGSQFGIAAAGDRIAIYYARRLQFSKAGKPEDMALSVITGNGGGTFQDLLWNSSATLATVVFSTPGGLRAESYSTTGKQTTAVGTISSRAQRMITAGDGIHLIERGVDTGIGFVDARNGRRRDLDVSKEARQNAPIAVSADGRWIAAVINETVVRLLSVTDGSCYADLPPPRSGVVTFISWSPSGDAIATLTQDGFVQVWSLPPWRDWLTAHRIPD